MIRTLAGLLMLVLAVSTRAAEPENLLTVNPGFEQEDFSTFNHGKYTFAGWEGINYLYNQHGVRSGDATEGKKFMHFDWGGSLATAPENRPAATPGFVYELRYDLRTLIGKYPNEWLGTTSFIDFFNAEGKRIKTCWGPDWWPQVQDRGAAPWQTITVRGVAPAGAVKVGVRVDAPTGQFRSQKEDFTQNRHVELDNFRLYRIDETADRLAVRRYRRLIEPGKPTTLNVVYAAIAPRTLQVKLVSTSGVPVCQTTQAAPRGRGRVDVKLDVPADLKPGDYTYQIRLLSDDSSSAKECALLNQTGAFSDQTVSPPPESDTFPADHPNLLRVGRWDESDPKHPRMIWYASEIRLRFSGTSASLLCSSADTGYGGPKSVALNVVVDGDEANIIKLKVEKFNARIPLVENLPDGIHTLTIFKAGESMDVLRFDGIALDAGKGLLKPEPLPTRKIEIYGDSVTSGGTANPAYFGYAPLLGRELNADVHVISKGGTGVSSSFSHMVTTLKFWNKLDFENAFDTSKCKPWDFSLWTPDAVFVAVGHNDMFNDGAAKFPERYQELIGDMRGVYPTCKIFCANTCISADKAHFQRAIMPLLERDANVRFAFQLSSWTDPKTAHPPTAGHAAMVYGDASRLSFADWIEEQCGWGIPLPPATKANP